MSNFNNFFNTNFVTYNKNGIESFIAMLKGKGFKETRADWFQCGSLVAIKYVYRNGLNFVSFSYSNDDRIQVDNYSLN